MDLLLSSSYSDPNLPCHNFQSGNGNVIRLGNLVQRNSSPENLHKPTFLFHDDGPSPIPQSQGSLPFDHGLRTTKFHSGFQRKNQDNITNEVADMRKTYTKISEIKGERLAEFRCQRLESIDRRNGYDIITGAKVAEPPKQRIESIKYLGDGLGTEAPLRGHNMLRDSSNRFFAPQYNGPLHDYRQSVLRNEGLLQEKKSGIIKTGVGEMTSYGIEDNFSKSKYTSLPRAASIGLVETRQPGKYTPRKQPKNPSGNLALTKTWGKGVPLPL